MHMGLRFLRKEGKGSPTSAPWNHLDAVGTQSSGPAPRVSDSAGPRKDPRVCISSQFPGDADMPDLGTVYGGWEH